MRLSRRRLNRLFPPPPPTPEGKVWRTAKGRTFLADADHATEDSRRALGNYDLYPKEVRDQLKEGRRKL
jgi:hypothetical protein